MMRRVGLTVLLATSCEGLQNMQYRTLQQKVGVQHEVVQAQQQNKMSQQKESRSILLHPSTILVQFLVALGFLAAGDKSDVDRPDPIREAAGPATADLGDIVEGGEDTVPAVIDVAMAPAAAAAAAVEENIGIADFLQQNGTTMGMIFLTAAFVQCMLAICTRARTNDDGVLTPMNASKHIAALFAMANGGGEYISESSFFHNLNVMPPNPENRFFRCCCFFCDRSKQPNCICIGLCPFCTAYAYEGCSVITIICLILMMTGYGFYGGFVFFILACCFWNPVRWGVNYPDDMVGEPEAAASV